MASTPEFWRYPFYLGLLWILSLICASICTGSSSSYAATTKDFQWTHECQQSFSDLKTALLEAGVVAFPDLDKEMVLATDASQTGVFAAIIQSSEGRLRPVSFYSKSLTSTERKFSTYERELLAIVLACEHFRVYLLGRRFLLLTDHAPLLRVLSAKLSTRRISGRLMRLQGFGFDVQHVGR